MTSSTQQSYTRVAVILHWLVALLIVINFVLGLLMESFAGTPTRDSVLFFHASIGSALLMLVVFRLYWRLTHRPPALPATMPRWQVLAADTMHWMLYLLLFLIPLTGYLHRNAGGHPINFFGLGDLPLLAGKDLALRLWTGSAHTVLVWLLAALVVAHIAAGLKHHFIDHDGVLARMR